VTHGLQYLPMVDDIVVLIDGSVSETGSYDTLLSHNGPFAQFIKTYLLDDEDEDPEGGKTIWSYWLPELAECYRNVLEWWICANTL